MPSDTVNVLNVGCIIMLISSSIFGSYFSDEGLRLHARSANPFSLRKQTFSTIHGSSYIYVFLNFNRYMFYATSTISIHQMQ